MDYIQELIDIINNDIHMSLVNGPEFAWDYIRDLKRLEEEKHWPKQYRYIKEYSVIANKFDNFCDYCTFCKMNNYKVGI